jgi:hypothetical protein
MKAGTSFLRSPRRELLLQLGGLVTFLVGGLFAWALEDLLVRPDAPYRLLKFACATAASVSVLAINAMRFRWIDRALPQMAPVASTARELSNDR